MRDLAVLFLHLIATVARLAGPGGARSVVAESILGKQQLLILNRSRPTVTEPARIRSYRRWLVCAAHSSWPADPFRYRIETINALEVPSSAEKPEISPTVLAQGTEEAGPKGTQPRSHCSGRPNETTESHLGLSADRSTDRYGLRYSNHQGCGSADSRRPLPTRAGPGWSFMAHFPWSHEGQSLESRLVPV